MLDSNWRRGKTETTVLQTLARKRNRDDKSSINEKAEDVRLQRINVATLTTAGYIVHAYEKSNCASLMMRKRGVFGWHAEADSA